MTKLERKFFANNVTDVAHDLLGKKLHFGKFSGIIQETEAYRGNDDEASHAYNGPTPRSKIMFGKPGFTYVYFIYGMYYCLNIVTEEEYSPSAVLIRGLLMPDIHLNGPGKLCKYLGITKLHNNIDLIDNENFYISKYLKSVKYIATPRIGIKKSTEKLWRFVLDKNLSL